MKYSFILLILFIIFSLGISAAALYRSEFLHENPAEAGGFGASPPVIRVGALKPGESFGTTIIALRGGAEDIQKFSVRVEAGDVAAPWIKTTPDKEAAFSAGSFQAPISVAINIPPDAVSGDYTAYVYLNNSIERSAGGGVGIALGARVEIGFSVLGASTGESGTARSSSTAITLKDTELYRTLRGRIIKKATSSGSWYVSYNTPLLIPLLNNFASFRDLLGSASLIEKFNLNYIPVGILEGDEPDTDLDGVPDYLELALGTNKANVDTDNDGYSDYYELENGFSPFVEGTVSVANAEYANNFSGQILWEKDDRENFWYVSVSNPKRYLLCDNCDNEALGTFLSEEISEVEWDKLLK